MNALRTVMIIAAMAAATLASPFAAAHASLKSSNPAAGATVDASPNEVTLTFNEKVEPAFSSITIADSQGKNVAPDKAKVDASNPAILRLPVPALASGTYTVNWAVAGHDGHRRKGDFKFSVK
ncbi:copper homeostasis periplasmic binding protein CopC [Rugamonas apoptosis]|uniref:Copper homeostasis periplasmic binding protein CopC n=1 Tax=Rugamonas apoptosis TaxID=2758570 RepID=A0A7W2IJB6_9BURK|nr:copper homeostasis periplasmic binding protein CopC [Rugamonas apoptosis]MBA5686388.1 copper homeostasis periplasmic binding protein CopC [Rugamonas apoptosis]